MRFLANGRPSECDARGLHWRKMETSPTCPLAKSRGPLLRAVARKMVCACILLPGELNHATRRDRPTVSCPLPTALRMAAL